MKFLLSLAIIAIGSGCSSSKFNGDDKFNSDNITIECERNSQTNAELVTSKITNNADNQKLVYNISITGCDGENVIIDGKALLFDINARANFDATPFTIQAGEETFQGQAMRVDNSDLFGNQGSQWYHFTTMNLETGLSAKNFTFSMDLSNISMEPVGNANQLSTFFRIGQTKPISTAVDFQP